MGAAAGPHVTRAVGLTTDAETAQPLTCGRPRQSGRRRGGSEVGVQGGTKQAPPRLAPAAWRSARFFVRPCGRTRATLLPAGDLGIIGSSIDWIGGVAGMSPADGGVPATPAPARGKAFPQMMSARRVTG